MSNIYLVITPEELKDAICSLLEQKRVRGYEVVVKPVEEFGRPPNPEQIREYVLNKKPRFLLLVGDYDKTPGYPLERVYTSNGREKRTPYLSDAYFSMQSDDYYPKIPTGRLSSNNEKELRAICDLLVSYPDDPDPEWKRRVILTGWIPRGPESSGFKTDAGYQCIEEIGSYFDAKLEFENRFSSSEMAKTVWGVRDSTKDSLKNAIEEGTLIVRYLGHGSPTSWGNIGIDDAFKHEAFTIGDIRRLELGEYARVGQQVRENWKVPLVISTTCLTGKIKRAPSFAEAWQKNCKAIGVFAADAISSTYWNDRITQIIFHKIVSFQKKHRIGELLVDAMKSFLDEFGYHDEFTRHTFKMYRYLGDPDTILATPEARKATLSETSTNGPALATKRGQLLLGWVGTGNLKLNFLSFESGRMFSNKKTLGDTSPDALALTVFKNKFVVAWTGTGQGNLNIMQSEDGQTWTDKVTLSETSQSSPALAVFKDNLYIAWRGVGNNKLNIMRSSDEKTWQNKRTMNDTTTSGPALVEFNKKLLLAWRGVGNNALNIVQSSDGSSFSNKVTLGETTTAKPYLHVHAGLAYLAWQGAGNQLLNVIQSGNGTDWKHKVTFSEKCIDGPALGTLRNDIVWSWTGTDHQHRLNTLLYDWRF